jgi:hypothetical protein
MRQAVVLPSHERHARIDPNQPRQARARIAALVGAALLSVCLVCTACSAATATPQPAATPTIATSTPVGPAKVNGPFLGGTENNFQAAFGAPTLSASQSRQYQTTIADTHVVIIALLGAGMDGDRVRFLRIAPADQGVTWNAATGEAMAKRFMPPDSTYQKDKQTQAVGTEHVYLSQLLAASFPPSVFVDLDTDAALTPGTFDYYCGGDVNADGGCVLLLGA